MLATLRIKNLALVTDLTLELQPGYNVITGETGAGKSIIIGALNLVLGMRADRNLIRAGADACSVEAIFLVGKLRPILEPLLEANGLDQCDQDQLLLRRSFSAAGANRQFVNGSPTTLSTLAALGEWLVDIHGPHDHQSLLQTGKQLQLLDAFGNLDSLRNRLHELGQRQTAAEREKAELVIDERTYAQQLDLLRFQAHEITAAQLQPGEDQQIEEDHNRASNAATLQQLSHSALNLLSEDDAALLTQAGTAGRLIHELQRLDPQAASIQELHAHIVSQLHDLQQELSAYADRLEFDPEQLQQLENRLNLLNSLKRKYGPSLAEVLDYGEKAKQKLAALEQRESELARLQGILDAVQRDMVQVSKQLSDKRRQIIPKLAKSIIKQLQDLDFKQSRFEIDLASAPLSPTGCDSIEFQFSPNPGEPLRPLRAIASSGEMARVMLAIKTVLAVEDQVPVLIFDEVDANVGGTTASAVALKMREIAQQRQVLCITHLAPVAATATTHFRVTKQVRDGRTTSEIQPLAGADRIDELSRMLGGSTEAARKHAESLLKTLT